jgi:hypothetical protein
VSLTNAEQRATADELRANLELSGLTSEQVATDLSLTVKQLDAIFAVKRARPEDVWWLRDYLERAVRDAGREPHPYTSLTPEMRGAAAAWFPLRTPPEPSHH